MRTVGILAVLALVGCSVDESLAPAAAPTASATTAPVDAGSDAPEPPPFDAGVVKRTISVRNPIGVPVNNLFADGDFELSTVPGPGGQYGVLGFEETGGYRQITTETGGLCRTGLHCAWLDPKKILYFRGVAANHQKGELISFWVKVPAGIGCKGLLAVMVTCDNLLPGVVLKTTVDPEADGWCEYKARSLPVGSSQCLYIQNNLKSDLPSLVDSAVQQPDDGTVSMDAAETWVPGAELMETLGRVRETLQKNLPVRR